MVLRPPGGSREKLRSTKHIRLGTEERGREGAPWKPRVGEGSQPTEVRCIEEARVLTADLSKKGYSRKSPTPPGSKLQRVLLGGKGPPNFPFSGWQLIFIECLLCLSRVLVLSVNL